MNIIEMVLKLVYTRNKLVLAGVHFLGPFLANLQTLILYQVSNPHTCTSTLDVLWYCSQRVCGYMYMYIPYVRLPEDNKMSVEEFNGDGSDDANEHGKQNPNYTTHQQQPEMRRVILQEYSLYLPLSLSTSPLSLPLLLFITCISILNFSPSH